MNQNGITYKELAKLSGISISAIEKIFAGISEYPRLETIQAIENALGLTATDMTELSFEEVEIINSYRALNEPGKELIRQTLKTLKK